MTADEKAGILFIAFVALILGALLCLSAFFSYRVKLKEIEMKSQVSTNSIELINFDINN